MAFCVGFPYCRNLIDDEINVACRTCWFKLPSKLRNEMKAAIYKWGKETYVFQATRKRVEVFLYKRLESSVRRQDNIKRFTVVGGNIRTKKYR